MVKRFLKAYVWCGQFILPGGSDYKGLERKAQDASINLYSVRILCQNRVTLRVTIGTGLRL